MERTFHIDVRIGDKTDWVDFLILENQTREQSIQSLHQQLRNELMVRAVDQEAEKILNGIELVQMKAPGIDFISFHAALTHDDVNRIREKLFEKNYSAEYLEYLQKDITQELAIVERAVLQRTVSIDDPNLVEE